MVNEYPSSGFFELILLKMNLTPISKEKVVKEIKLFMKRQKLVKTLFLPSPPSARKPRTLLYHIIASSISCLSIMSRLLFSSSDSKAEIERDRESRNHKAIKDSGEKKKISKTAFVSQNNMLKKYFKIGIKFELYNQNHLNQNLEIILRYRFRK